MWNVRLVVGDYTPFPYFAFLKWLSGKKLIDMSGYSDIIE